MIEFRPHCLFVPADGLIVSVPGHMIWVRINLI